MKVWNGYGSEHSMNLVLIGIFKEASGAEQAKRLIDALTEQVQKEASEKQAHDRRYSDEMLDLFRKSNVSMIGPAELEQLAYDVHVEVKDTKIVLTTDEVDVSAFVKLLLEKGARIEMFSAHDYPDAKRG